MREGSTLRNKNGIRSCLPKVIRSSDKEEEENVLKKQCTRFSKNHESHECSPSVSSSDNNEEGYVPRESPRRSPRNLTMSEKQLFEYQKEAILKNDEYTDALLEIQKYPFPKNRGLVAKVDIPKKTLIAEYRGFLCTSDEGWRRHRVVYRSSSNCYMFWFKYICRKTGKTISVCIDATAERQDFGLARIMNHSRHKLVQNCKAVLIYNGEEPHVFIQAIHDIKPGNELFFDYGDRDPESTAGCPWLKD